MCGGPWRCDSLVLCSLQLEGICGYRELAYFTTFSPWAKAALDGAKGVHGAVEGASGALGAIHGWQRAPESLAACGGVGPTAQGAVGEPESGGRYELGKCLLFGGRVLAFSVSDRYYSAHAFACIRSVSLSFVNRYN